MQEIIIVCLTALCVAACLSRALGKKKYEQRFLEYQTEALSKQVEEVNEIYTVMRGWRHDYHNHLQKLKAHAAMEQWDEVREYLDQLEGDLDKIRIKYKTGNVNLDAILNSKLSLAEKGGIGIYCKTELAEHISIPDIDLCVIIGNLIDNAMEACALVPAGERRFIRVYICVRKKQLYISVTNATGEPVRKPDREYISQKRGNHGHGLKRIDAAVEKWNGYIRRANEPGVFTTEIMLPLE